jgi:hypothetical protein
MSGRTTMNQERRQATMRTVGTFVFAALCEVAGKTCTYADAIRRRAQRLEYWAATRRDKCSVAHQLADSQLDQT